VYETEVSIKTTETLSITTDSEECQLGEIHKGIEDLYSGRTVSHDKVSKWLQTWGNTGETKAPM
jgi:predicted transcriptional regulator